MYKLIKDLIFAWRYKRAVKEANYLNEITKMRFFVILMNGSLKVVPKQALKELIARGRFKRGTKIQDLEKRALYITK